MKSRHKLVCDIEQPVEQFALNTAISGFIEYNNKLIELAKKEGGVDKGDPWKPLRDAGCPVAPHRRAGGLRAEPAPYSTAAVAECDRRPPEGRRD